MSRGWDPRAVGAIVFATVMMVVGGALQMAQGWIAIVDDGYFAMGEDYLFAFDQTAWGWIHIVLGLLLVTAGLTLLRGSTWARGVAVAVAGLSIVTNFLWLPISPLWSLTTIAMSLAVIWAVTSHGHDAEVMRSGAPSTPSEPRTYE